MPKLTCCIITKNEADRIGRCISAISSLADEIVVVDSGSTDDTLSIAKNLGAKIFHNDWKGFGQQKRFAEECATNDWILNIDADEVISTQLAQEIRALMMKEPQHVAYRIRLPTVYPGAAAPRLWADEHNYIRLYDRRRVRFRESAVHDTVDAKNEAVGQLKWTALHFSYKSLEHLASKMENYTDLQAKTLKKPLWQLRLREPFEYSLVFLQYYFLRCHFTGGQFGLSVAKLIARQRAKRISKMIKWAETQSKLSTPN